MSMFRGITISALLTAFLLVPTSLAFSSRSGRRMVSLIPHHMVSASSETASASTDLENEQSYSIRRGDGMTGGGGLPMPGTKSLADTETIDQEEDGLVRPKVRHHALPHGMH
eukprot:scaffold92173_cov48-Attheya_sp.AAC.6